MKEEGWAGNIDEALGRICRVSIGSGKIRVLSGGHRIALGLPDDKAAARVVLEFYQPQRLKGRLFRLVAGILVKSGLYRRVLSPTEGCLEGPEVGWLKEAAADGRVGFLGCNPSHGLRCILAGVDADGERFVGKLGFGRSRKAVVREGGVLKQLEAGGRPGILKALALDKGEDWALLRLPHLGCRGPRNMDDPAVLELLRGWLGDETKPLGGMPWAADLLREAEESGVDGTWCETMRGKEIRSALVHGDFAVWNLRQPPGGPCAIDWEWAVEDGVGGVDLAYGLRQEALLVHRLKPAQAVLQILERVRSGHFNQYLDSCGWRDAHEDWLKFGLLHTQFNAKSDCRQLLAVLGHRGESEAQ